MTQMETKIRRQAVRDKLAAHRISVPAFAERVGISASHMYLILQGHKACSQVTLLRMIDVLEALGEDPPTTKKAPQKPEGIMVRVRGM